jgi:hypothetical protein
MNMYITFTIYPEQKKDESLPKRVYYFRPFDIVQPITHMNNDGFTFYGRENYDKQKGRFIVSKDVHMRGDLPTKDVYLDSPHGCGLYVGHLCMEAKHVPIHRFVQTFQPYQKKPVRIIYDKVYVYMGRCMILFLHNDVLPEDLCRMLRRYLYV